MGRRVIQVSTLTSRVDWSQLHALRCVQLQRQMKLSSHTLRQVLPSPVVRTSRLLSSQKLHLSSIPQSKLSELADQFRFELAKGMGFRLGHQRAWQQDFGS